MKERRKKRRWCLLVREGKVDCCESDKKDGKTVKSRTHHVSCKREKHPRERASLLMLNSFVVFAAFLLLAARLPQPLDERHRLF